MQIEVFLKKDKHKPQEAMARRVPFCFAISKTEYINSENC